MRPPPMLVFDEAVDESGDTVASPSKGVLGLASSIPDLLTLAHMGPVFGQLVDGVLVAAHVIRCFHQISIRYQHIVACLVP